MRFLTQGVARGFEESHPCDPKTLRTRHAEPINENRHGSWNSAFVVLFARAENTKFRPQKIVFDGLDFWSQSVSRQLVYCNDLQLMLFFTSALLM